jgi:hypothetical protein
MKRFLKDRGVTETTYDGEKASYQIKRHPGCVAERLSLLIFA